MVNNRISPVHYIICFLFCIFFRYLPPFAGITPLGMGILGTFIGAVYGWITIGVLWPSILGIAGMTISLGMNAVLTSGFGNIVFVGLILCIPLIDVCTKTGALDWIIQKILTSKILNNKKYLTLFIIFLAVYLLSFGQSMVIVIVFCAFATQMFNQIGVKKDDKLAIYTYLGIAISSQVGQILFPFVGTGLLLSSTYNAMFPDFPLNYIKYMMFMLPMGVFTIVAYTLALKYIFRVDASKISEFEVDGEIAPISKDQIIALVCFMTFILFLVVSALPLGIISTEATRLGMLFIAMVLFAILDYLPSFDRPGEKLFNLEASLQSVPWSMGFMLVYIMLLAVYMNGPDTGIAVAMASLLQPFMALPPLVFIIVALLFACIVTNVASNLVVIVLVMPFMFNFAMTINLVPTGMMALLFVMAQLAIATPGASPIAAVAMSQELANPKKMTQEAIKIIAVMFMLMLAFGWALVEILF